ncbi:hypothetical protein RFI_11703 [Reticulomyxa filosa]|uniref:Protein kinase domain-containing protein n=1 Tax=Reticulomyxa filosa TaxID=46433 RepID=X6NGK3_RETFI|nr:hypothetical protein RFI_11703 [Reticulomyxa filosa]|eukprot:ETO25435.1 hypothetical protein RFI_11703 [Reticulomyxa filosa]
MIRRVSMNWNALHVDEGISKITHVTTDKGTCSNIEVCVKSYGFETAVPRSALEHIVQDIISRHRTYHKHLACLYAVRLVDRSAEKLGQQGYAIETLCKWYSKGSLYDIIVASPKHIPFAHKVIVRIALQLAQVLQYIHYHLGTCHGFLKSKNILFDDVMNVKLTDFGLIGLKQTMQVFMPKADFDGYWCDPAYFSDGLPLTPECDIWAYGFILYQLVTKKIPFAESTFEETKKAIVDLQLPAIPVACPAFLRDVC